MHLDCRLPSILRKRSPSAETTAWSLDAVAGATMPLSPFAAAADWRVPVLTIDKRCRSCAAASGAIGCVQRNNRRADVFYWRLCEQHRSQFAEHHRAGTFDWCTQATLERRRRRCHQAVGYRGRQQGARSQRRLSDQPPAAEGRLGMDGAYDPATRPAGARTQRQRNADGRYGR